VPERIEERGRKKSAERTSASHFLTKKKKEKMRREKRER